MTRVNQDDLATFITQLAKETGANDTSAVSVAQSLVSADLRGHHSHGTLRVPLYAEKVENGLLAPTA
jgi:uncharacterized oxidoreductase